MANHTEDHCQRELRTQMLKNVVKEKKEKGYQSVVGFRVGFKNGRNWNLRQASSREEGIGKRRHISKKWQGVFLQIKLSGSVSWCYHKLQVRFLFVQVLCCKLQKLTLTNVNSLGECGAVINKGGAGGPGLGGAETWRLLTPVQQERMDGSSSTRSPPYIIFSFQPLPMCSRFKFQKVQIQRI